MSRFFLRFCLIFLLALILGGAAHAQLATSFSNLTAIRVNRLPNAIQIRLETNGNAKFGTDLNEFVDFSSGFNPKPTSTLTIRLVQTRAKVPAFVPLDAYPADGATITPGRTSFQNPYFSRNAYAQTEPLTDVQLRFATPLIVRKFSRESLDSYDAIRFGDALGPNEVGVELSSDRRAVIVTIVPDRADLGGEARLNRSPLAQRHKSLKVVALGGENFALESLNSPLHQVLAAISDATQTRFVARAEIADLPVSANLPRADFAVLRTVLERGYGIGARQNDDGSWIFGRGDEFWQTRVFPLRNLTPDAARLAFPDFLLPQLRIDLAQNALLAFAPTPVLDKIGADLQKIDAPRAQFEIVAQVWEIVLSKQNIFSLNLGAQAGGARAFGLGLNSENGASSVRVERGQTTAIQAQLQLLQSQAKARLIATPHVRTLAGAKGSLFLGQTRYIKVLQNQYGAQVPRALALQIGTQLDVTPRGAGDAGTIFLDVAPRVSTVDEIEGSTGLPTIGIREIASSARLQEGQSLVIAGLDQQTDFAARGQTLKIVPSRRRDLENRRLLVLVQARRVA